MQTPRPVCMLCRHLNLTLSKPKFSMDNELVLRLDFLPQSWKSLSQQKIVKKKKGEGKKSCLEETRQANKYADTNKKWTGLKSISKLTRLVDTRGQDSIS